MYLFTIKYTSNLALQQFFSVSKFKAFSFFLEFSMMDFGILAFGFWISEIWHSVFWIFDFRYFEFGFLITGHFPESVNPKTEFPNAESPNSQPPNDHFTNAVFPNGEKSNILRIRKAENQKIENTSKSGFVNLIFWHSGKRCSFYRIHWFDKIKNRVR